MKRFEFKSDVYDVRVTKSKYKTTMKIRGWLDPELAASYMTAAPVDLLDIEIHSDGDAFLASGCALDGYDVWEIKASGLDEDTMKMFLQTAIKRNNSVKADVLAKLVNDYIG